MAMIKVLMLDLGKTLIDKNNQPFPGVQDALGKLKNFETAEHKPLVTCLVSDFDKTFDDYLAILDQTGLRGFFEPVDERVTLSIHANAEKPDAKVFETALKRAKVDGSIKDALFITEEEVHVKACRVLGMKALQFGKDFTDWLVAPELIKKQIGIPGAP
jgi:FMN phosphatase YigB (HAD superfamily)